MVDLKLVNSPDRSVKIGQILSVKINDLSRRGSGVARLESGLVVFVPYLAPGDEANVRVKKVQKNYIHAELVDIINYSKQRIEPKCQYFMQCGGCDWQHIPYTLQWQTKMNGICRAMSQFGIDVSALKTEEFPSENIWHYRNRIQLRGNAAHIGFYRKGTQEIIPIQRCEIAKESINFEILNLRARAPTREFKAEIFDYGEVKVTWNSKNAEAGFRQVNEAQNLNLCKFIDSIILNNSYVLDLFGGNGNLSKGLINRVSKVTIVDVNAQSPIEYKELEAIKSPVHQWLKKLGIITASEPIVAIIDPPREGLGAEQEVIINNLARVGVRSIILVGCNSDAWIKDLLAFKARGWEIAKLGFFDFFPHTVHLESVALLTLFVG